MSDLKNQYSSMELILREIRCDYLEALPSRLHEMEQLILKLTSRNNFIENYHEIYRYVHNIKGSAGTHGLHILSRISHRFENHLTTIIEKHEYLDKKQTDHLLQFIDLLGNARTSLNDDINVFTNIEIRLDALDLHIYQNISKVLIVEQSKSIIQVLSKILSDFPVQIVTSKEGLQSLERLLHEKFDLMFVAMELPLLNGLAIIAALRLANTMNSEIPIILLTSNPEIQIDSTIAADYIIQRDKSFADSATKAVKKVFC